MPRLSVRWRFAIVPVVTLFAFSVQLALFPKPGVAPFVVFYVAVALASCLGGRIAGLLAVAISAVLANSAFIGSFGWASSGPALPATALFVVIASTIALLCGWLRDSLVREEQAAETLQRQADILALSHDAIVVWGRDLGIETWSKGAEELFGFSAEEARGRMPHELLKTSFPPSEIEAELGERRRWNGELIQTTKEGRTVAVLAKVQLLSCRDGIARVLESYREVIARTRFDKELQLAHERAETLARLPKENPDPVLRLSNDLEVLYANDSALSTWAELRVENGALLARELAEPSRRALGEARRMQQELTIGGSTFSMTFDPTGNGVKRWRRGPSVRICSTAYKWSTWISRLSEREMETSLSWPGTSWSTSHARLTSGSWGSTRQRWRLSTRTPGREMCASSNT